MKKSAKNRRHRQNRPRRTLQIERLAERKLMAGDVFSLSDDGVLSIDGTDDRSRSAISIRAH